MKASEVLELLDYRPSTGDFVWRSKGNGRVLGRPAGHVTSMGYRSIKLRGRPLLVHRLVWLVETGQMPAGDIDHINGDPLDNRFTNLRSVDRRTNIENQRRAHANSRSGVLGVSERGGKWRAEITHKGARLRLGTFDSIEKASDAYIQAKRRLHAGCTI